jgi:putative spermidine/putrescine transport system permease protein
MTTLAAIKPTDAPLAQVGPLTTADGTPLAVKLAQASRRQRLRAFALVVPILIFTLVLFVAPMLQMLWLSFSDEVIATEMPLTTAKIAAWKGPELPGEDVYAAVVADLKSARERQAAGKIGSLMNHVYSGARSVVVSASRGAGSMEAPFKQALMEKDEAWRDPRFWATLKSMSSTPTSMFYLNALDRTIDEKGNVALYSADQRIHITIFFRTLWLSALVTGLCVLLGYPVAYLLAALPMRISNLLMICVLLPFWTALLVRITAWIAMLQSDGVLLASLASMGLVDFDTAKRPQLIYNLTGTLIAMVHVLLPSMILPLYSVMKTIPPSYVRAARSLGASPFTAFRRVYFPQTVPGIAAGGLLVFILSVGYYITPALLGGQDGVLISNFIALHVEKTLNWGLAAALAGLLLVAILILYWIFNRIVGIERLKMG